MTSSQREKEDRARKRKKHWLATPKPFIAWGIFMGLATGGAFGIAGLSALREGTEWAAAICITLAVLFPPGFTVYSWWSERNPGEGRKD